MDDFSVRHALVALCKRREHVHYKTAIATSVAMQAEPLKARIGAVEAGRVLWPKDVLLAKAQRNLILDPEADVRDRLVLGSRQWRFELDAIGSGPPLQHADGHS